ncbi:MAG: tetratricopeptide repeat protein [Ottowia sp.]
MLELLGVAWAAQGRWDEALACQQALVDLLPEQPAGWINLANTQAALGQFDGALASLARAEDIDAAQPAVHFNRGNVRMQQGDHSAASESFRRAGELAPQRPDPFCNQAMALNALGRHQEALQILQRVVARHPGLAQGWNLLGITWHKLEADRQALESYQRAAQCAPQWADAYSNAAQVLARMERLPEAEASARRAVQLDPTHADALRTLGVVLVSARQPNQAREWLERAHQQCPQDVLTLSNLLALESAACNWAAAEQHLAALRGLWRQGRGGVEPWRLLSFDIQMAELRTLTEREGARYAARAAASTFSGEHLRRGPARPERLRIGYFSSDFHQHATAYLAAGMFEQHDRMRFETMAFCFGRYPHGLQDPMRERLHAAFDRFETVRELNDIELVRLARSFDLHVAVDLKGHTKDSRQGIFAQRVAPVQMHYLGYPGTLGMPGAIDYLVADRLVVPPCSRDSYSEKIIELPDSYQVNDRGRAIDHHTPSRAELGLPARGFVFCCFNNNYKITRDVFPLWMALLRQRPGSVLWLLEDNPIAAANLRAAATAANVDAARLVFAPRVPLPRHLARHAQADLFLDTLHYNAHTTASDALWAGLPVLTCMGQTFAARVGASLLTACGLPELIASSPEDYLNLALALSSDPARLSALRQRLESSRMQVPLFDTARFTRHIERAYDMAWDRFERGLPPDHLVVPPID